MTIRVFNLRFSISTRLIVATSLLTIANPSWGSQGQAVDKQVPSVERHFRAQFVIEFEDPAKNLKGTLAMTTRRTRLDWSSNGAKAVWLFEVDTKPRTYLPGSGRWIENKAQPRGAREGSYDDVENFLVTWSYMQSLFVEKPFNPTDGSELRVNGVEHVDEMECERLEYRNLPGEEPLVLYVTTEKPRLLVRIRLRDAIGPEDNGPRVFRLTDVERSFDEEWLRIEPSQPN